ncbi:hypothetical protein LO762_19705 [Actinocorallia sp. API 0066]|uniref:hypothetical protein n=1 Tax=Actinocorallia sp. API 0066 TaxID=2896846 RepID=UPI001E608645|nr:hypothetical protein [Actinocorallia sp. API 0066]MCD0451408.1 hypothetical protein [Actinocorallia sp. API 0066]
MARPGLLLTGFALCAAGGFVLHLRAGRDEGVPVLDDDLTAFATAHAWFWPLITAVLAVGAGAGLYWLTSEGRAAALRRLPLMRGKVRTRAALAELTCALEDLPGVKEVQLRLSGSRARSRLVLHVSCEESADLGLLLGLIREAPLTRFREAVGLAGLHSVIRFRLVYQETRIA